VRNIIFGVIHKVITIVGPFVIRTVILYTLGAEYLGLSSLFTALLSVLSLAELGIGSALVFSMYKPVAEKDDDTVCALLALYRKLYYYIGSIIGSIGLILMPFLRYFVKGDCPADINMYILYSIYLFNTLISYFAYGYKQSILYAYQRNDVMSKRLAVVQMAMYIGQVLVLLLTKNYYVYIILLPIATLITNFANSIAVDRMYPQYTCRGEVSKELKVSITKKVTALIGTKLDSVVLHSSDNIIISAFLGLVAVAQYGNYFYVLNSIMSILLLVFGSMTAGVGNSLQTETLDKNRRDFRVFNLLNAWITGWCSVCFLSLYQPFIRFSTGDESMMMSYGFVILLVVQFYIYQIRRVVLTYKDAAGIWWEDKFRPYVIMITNLSLNIILVNVIGIYGVVLSTIISLVVSVPWETWLVFKNVLRQSPKRYYLDQLVYLAVTVITSAITLGVCSLIPLDGLWLIFTRFIVCCILPNAIFLLAYRRMEAFEPAKEIMMRVIRSKGKKA